MDTVISEVGIAHSAHRVARVAARDAAAADSRGGLHDETAAAIIQAGFARHFVPSRWSGTEGTFTELADAIATVGEGCASTAWTAALFAAHGRLAANLPLRGQHDLWGQSPDVPIAAALAPPSGRAQAADDGWLVEGEWSRVSAVERADWVLIASPASAGANTEVIVLAVPTAEIVVHDTWSALGLHATGTHSITLPRPVHVPRHRSFRLADLVTPPGAASRPRCHAVPAHLVGGLIFSAPALGAARSVLQTWVQRHSDQLAGAGPTGGNPTLTEALVRSSAEIETAQILLETVARRGDSGPTDSAAVTRGRRDSAFATELLLAAVDRLFRTAGSAARGQEHPIARGWRDVHTIATHAVLRLTAVANEQARNLAGPTR
jgi:alkylation response protein AidB-like acyl-CoA dehydrogenase